MHLSVPFFVQPDPTHCHQAALKMMMKYFWPDKEFTWDELDILSAKKVEAATWTYAGDIWLADHGMEVVVVELFDHLRFAKEGVSYIEEYAGKEIAAWQDTHSDIPAEQLRATVADATLSHIHKVPTLDDVKSFLNDGYLILCLINGKAIDGKEGYVGHRVVLIGYTDIGVYMHDPWKAEEHDRFVTNEIFEKAWAYPDENLKNLTAYKPKA